MVDRFCIDHANPSWPTNRWITAMMRLFKPQITALLTHRDAVVANLGVGTGSISVTVAPGAQYCFRNSLIDGNPKRQL